MELADLRYFVAVATAQSFVGGARRVHVTPPAVSKAVRKLEDELGVSLFVRTTRRVELTGAGAALLERARPLLAGLEALRDLEAPAAVPRGELRIGAMEVFSIYLLPRAITRLVRAHPAVIPATFELVPARIAELLEDGRLDVGFTIGSAASRRIERREIGRSPGLLVCGRTHPLYRVGRVRRADLLAHPSVAPRFLDLEHLPPLDQFPEHAYPRRVGASIELLQMGVELAVGGAYLGWFPEVSVRPHLESGRLRALRGVVGAPAFELQAWTRAGQSPKPAVAAIVSEVARAISEQGKR